MTKQLPTIVQFKIVAKHAHDIYATVLSNRPNEMHLTFGRMVDRDFLDMMRNPSRVFTPVDHIGSHEVTDFEIIG